ncbi:MAG: hypothetical protein EOO20_22180 [Chryseobacterium sp.]|nr:MAG: hypothetical protein EOO20_22180 [Chryseobacterium sp.]
MQLSVKLNLSKKSTEDGFPIILKISHGQNRPSTTIGRSWPEHFSDEAQMVTDDHPDYDILAPKIMDIKSKGKKIILQGKEDDPEVVLKEILKKETSGVTFNEFYDILIAQMNELKGKYEALRDVNSRNKVAGNIKVYQNAVTQFKDFVQDIKIVDIDYDILVRFRNYQTGLGNKKNTVHLYLRTIRAIYNKALLFYKLPDSKPFKGVFSNLKTKSYANKKKYLTKQSIAVLEGLKVKTHQKKYLDMFLLQFYLGGCDLIDLYFLKKKQIRKGRIYFERGKTENPLMVDLKIFPKAKEVIDYHSALSDDIWLFPWPKDINRYESFRRALGKALVAIQKEQNTIADNNDDEASRIDIMPTGGNLGIKVARHTFANIGKGLMIHEDILRELQGHERDEVDNYYKDKYPEELRDQAHLNIIST